MRRTLTVLATAALAVTGCASDDGDPAASPSDEETTSPTPDDTTSPTPDDTTSPTPDETGPDDETDPDSSPSPSEDGTASPSPTPTIGDDVAAMEFTTCQAEEYTVSHPAGWRTNEPSGLVDACRVFHPGPVDLPDEPQGIDLQWAATLRIDEVPYEDVVASDPTGDLLKESTTTVDGRDARVTEVRSDDEGLVPEGETSYGYAVDLDGRTLFARTYTVGETDYERDKRVLDRMVASLELAAGE